MDSRDMPLSFYGWRPSWIWLKKRVRGVEKFEPYDFRVIWSLMMQYPPLTQFGQTNLANSIFVTSQPPLYDQCAPYTQYTLSLMSRMHHPLGPVFEWNFRQVIFKLISVTGGWVLHSLCQVCSTPYAQCILRKLASDECYWTLLMISQHWFR